MKTPSEQKIILLLNCSISFFLVFSFLFFLFPVFAGETTIETPAETPTFSPVTNLFSEGTLEAGNPEGFFRDSFSLIFRLILSFVGVTAVVLFVIHGTHLIYAQLSGKVAAALNQRSRLISVFIGITLLLTSYLILEFVSSQLVDPALFRNLQNFQASRS